MTMNEEYAASIHDLPMDVIVTILSLSSVKSLARFRCVCKSWLELIHDPAFKSIYAAAQKNNNVTYLFSDDSLFLRWNRNKITNKLNEPAFESIVPPVTIPPGSFLQFHGSCNGLVCFSYLGNSRWFIWNPSSNRVKAVDPGEEIYECYGEAGRVLTGFGSCKVGGFDDFKAVKDTWAHGLCVYTLSTNKWKKIEPAASNRVRYPSCFSPSTWINEKLHWVVRGLTKDRANFVLTFDLQTEVCADIALPETKEVDCWYEIGALGESLSLVIHSESKISFWVLKEYGVEGSWTRLYSFDTIQAPISRKTSILHQVNGTDVLLMDLSDSYELRFAMFDFETGRWIRDLRRQHYNFSSGVAYTESLASLDDHKWWGCSDEEDYKHRYPAQKKLRRD